MYYSPTAAFKRLFFIVLFFTISFNLSAQSNWVITSDYVNKNIDACSDGEEWHVIATHPEATTDISFVINFPTGITYQSLTEISSVGISTSATVGDNSVTITVPNLQANQSVEFNIKRKAACDAINFDATGGVFFDELVINYNEGGPQTYVSNNLDDGNGNYSVNVPTILVTNATSAKLNANIDEKVNHLITIENRGQNSSVNDFFVDLTFNTGFEFDQANFTLGTYDATNNRLTFTNLTALGGDLADGSFDFGDSYVLSIPGIIKNCNPQASYNAGYKCGEADACAETATFAVNQNTEPGFPEVDVTVSSDYQASYGCPNSVSTVTYTFTNTAPVTPNGSNFASSVIVDLGANWNLGAISDPNRPLNEAMNSNADLTQVFANGVALPNTILETDIGIFRVRFDLLTDAALATSLGLQDLDADGFYDDLPENTTITLTATSSPSCSRNWYGLNAARMIFNNQCNTNLELSYKRGGYYLNNSYRNAGENDLFFPSDVDSGTSFTIEANIASQFDPRAYTGCANQYSELVIEFSEPMDFSSVNFNDSLGRAITHSVNANNTELTVKIPLIQNSNTQDLSEFLIEEIIFSCNQESTITANWKWQYVCEDCATCKVLWLTGQSEIRTHECVNANGSPSNTCEGIATQPITVQRTTLGWASAADYRSGQAPLPDNTPGLRRDFLLERDKLNVFAPSIIEGNKNYEEVGVTISYDTQHAFTFNDGTVELVDASSGITYQGTITGLPTIALLNGQNTMTFDFDDLSFNGLPNNFLFSENDQINFNINLTLDTAPYSRLTRMDEFSVTHFGITQNFVKESCETYGAELMTGKVEYGDFASGSQSIGCGDAKVNVYQTVKGVYQDNFVNEYRPNNKIKRIAFDIPQGYIYIPNSTEIRYINDGLQIFNPGEPDPVALSNGRFVIEDASNQWPESKFDHATSCCIGYRFEMRFKPTCSVSESAPPINVEVLTNNYLYDHTQSVVEQTINKTITEVNYDKPDITHNNPAEVTAFADTASWEVSFSNPENYDLDYTWIKITSPTNQTNLQSVELSGSALPIITDGNGVWYVNTGGLNANSTKTFEVKANFTNCNKDQLLIDFGYTCLGQPTTFAEYENVSCSFDEFALKYSPAPARVEVATITPSVNVDEVCTNVSYELEINNSDLGALYDMEVSVGLPDFNNQASEFPISYIANSLEVSYDNGANWTSVTDAGVVNGTGADFTVNMNTVSAESSGVLHTDGLIGGARARIRFNLDVSCSHIPGTSPNITIAANAPCNGPAVGSGSNFNAPPITVTGISNTFITDVDLVIDDSNYRYCGNSTIAAKADLTITGGITDARDELKLEIPKEFAWNGNLRTDTNGDGTVDTNVTPVSVTTVNDVTTVIWKAQPGVANGEKLNYEFSLKANNVPYACNTTNTAAVNLEYRLPRTLICSGNGACPSVTYISTGEDTESIDLNRAEVVLENTSISSEYNAITNKEEVTVVYTIENTSSYSTNSNIVIRFFSDANNDGQYQNAELVHNYTIASAVVAGDKITETVTFEVDPDKVCDLYVKMSAYDNCVCLKDPTKLKAPEAIDAIAGGDANVCFESSVQLGEDPNAAYTYTWTGKTANDDVSYLSATNVANPTFEYTGTTLTSNTSFTYVLTVERVGGSCAVSTDEVTVTQSPEPTEITADDETICSTEKLTITFSNRPTSFEVIELFTDAALTTPANPATTSTTTWESSNTFAAGTGSIWARVRNTTTNCVTNAIKVDYTSETCIDLSLVKSVANNDTKPYVGDNVEFRLLISNAGPSEATGIDVEDVLPVGYTFVSASDNGQLNGNTINWSDLTVPANSKIVVTYIVTVNAITGATDEFKNIAQITDADGVDTDSNFNNDDGDQSEDDEDSLTTTPLDPSIELEKEGTFNDENGDGFAQVGETISYTFSIENTGNVTLTNVTVTDAKVDVNGSAITSLASGATDDTTFTATYTITQDDIDAGGVDNVATVTGKDPKDNNVTDESEDPTPTNPIDVSCTNCTTVTLAQNPAQSLIKTFAIADTSGDGVSGNLNDVITYTLSVTNTGNVTLSNVMVTDAQLNVTDQVVTPSELAPNATGTFVVTHTITQDDLDEGFIVNTASSSAETPSGDTNDPSDDITDTSDTGTDADGDEIVNPNTVDSPDNNGNTDGNPTNDVTVTLLATNFDVSVEKEVDIANPEVDEEIEFTITVKNEGNVTATNIKVEDVLPSAYTYVSHTTSAGTYTQNNGEWVIANLNPEAEETLTIKVTSLATGDRTNTATITNAEGGTDSNSGNDTSSVSTTPNMPAIELFKEGTFNDENGDGFAQVGETISYTFTINNTGNVPLTNITVTDPKVNVNGSTIASLAVGATDSTTFTATYTITQADIDAGGIDNLALVTSKDPRNNDVTDQSEDPTPVNPIDASCTNCTTVMIPQNPSLSLIKSFSIADTNGDGILGTLNDIITYTFEVINTGNTTITNAVVSDDMLNLTNASVTPSTLKPGESGTLEVNYTIIEDDTIVGFLENTASTSGEIPNGDTGDSSDDVTDVSDAGTDPEGNPINNPNEVDSPDFLGETDGDPTNDVTITWLNGIVNLGVTKEVDNLTPVIGQEVVFTITVTNYGNFNMAQATIEEEIRSGYEFVSYQSTHGIYSVVDGIWNIGALNINETATMTIICKVLPQGDYRNIALVPEQPIEGPDRDPDNDVGSVEIQPLCLEVYNEFSPNGDGDNETFVIDCIERYSNNSLSVFNRWGNEVYQKDSYKNEWEGVANVGVSKGKPLPAGTYYYVLKLGEEGKKDITGWLYINR